MASKMKDKFNEGFCVGIIDEDRKNLDYLKEFVLAIENKYLKLWKHNTKNQYIIQIRPVIEKWVLKICEDSGINIGDFNLPDDWKKLVMITKSVSSKEDQRFIRLFKEMKKRKVEPVLQLQSWLEYLKTNKFNADINRL